LNELKLDGGRRAGNPRLAVILLTSRECVNQTNGEKPHPGIFLSSLYALELTVLHKTVAEACRKCLLCCDALLVDPVVAPAGFLSSVWRMGPMAKSETPTTIKKYANRRLYNTGTSTYVTLEDLAAMVKQGEDFLVFDAKTGDDITRSVLAQIIFEQENKAGQNLLPTTFLRQLIRFYGDSMQMVVPKYLERSIDMLTQEQEKFRKQMTNTFSGTPFAPLEEHVRRNMELFERTFAMFKPFVPPRGGSAAPEPEKTPDAPTSGDNIEDLRRQMKEMQERLERMSKEPKKE
jgi:polyhydroxyalkanoate synthesis repressor PhaR